MVSENEREVIMKENLQIGSLLRANTAGFIAGCSVSQLNLPVLGAMVKVPIKADISIYGLISDIHIDDDGLVRQLVTVGSINAEVVNDSRERRIVPVEISVISIGYERVGRIYYLLPPQPPLSLDTIWMCSAEELARFTDHGGFGYFRHIFRAKDLPVGEILAAHILQVRQVLGNEKWVDAAIHELITQLRDDYPLLMSVLDSFSDAIYY